MYMQHAESKDCSDSLRRVSVRIVRARIGRRLAFSCAASRHMKEHVFVTAMARQVLG